MTFTWVIESCHHLLSIIVQRKMIKKIKIVKPDPLPLLAWWWEASLKCGRGSSSFLKPARGIILKRREKFSYFFSGKPCPDLRQRQEPWFPPRAGRPCCLSGARLSHLLLQGSAMSRIFSHICLLPILNLWCQSSVGGGEDDDCVVKDTSLFPFLLVRHPVINKSLSTLG